MAQTTEDPAPKQEYFLRVSGSGDNPWEIHRVQPVIAKLVEQDIFHGEVLDIGCCIGDNAIYIAAHAKDVHVTAIDIATKALEVARGKAQQSNVKNIRFEIVNMLDDPSSSILNGHSFDVVLDSAVFHGFSDEDRLRYLDSIRHLIKPGGLYIQFCRGEKDPPTAASLPRRIKKEDLYEIFSSPNGWTIESIADAQYDAERTTSGRTQLQFYLTLIRRNEDT